MDPFEIGDPYVEWEEVNAAQEPRVNDTDLLTEFFIEEHRNMFDMSALRDEVVKILMSNHDFLVNDAEEAVQESVSKNPDFWNENADANDLANVLAEDDDDE
jgi:hypothetical protein